jgi:hypothetical protein
MRLSLLLRCFGLTCFAVVSAMTVAAQASADPQTPAARPFHDSRYGISFQVPAAWNLSSRDGDVSTFRLDARSALRASQLRAVASIAFNPLPASTFSGALFYASVAPGVTAASCKRQGALGAARVSDAKVVSGIAFDHSHDEHGGVCTESRDEVYTTFRSARCYRFDLVINNFCGGDVSGVRDMTDRELEAVRKRLEDILATVQFDVK